MFVSKRALVVVVSLALAVGCGSAAEDGSNDGSQAGSPSASSSSSQGSSPTNADEGAPNATGTGGGGGGTTSSSSGGSSSGGGITPAAVPLTCTQCSAFAADQASAGAKQSWELCNGGAGIPESYALYADYLGCLCSGPCVNECETSLCALVPTAASPTCKSCLALNNAACSASKTACLADQ